MISWKFNFIINSVRGCFGLQKRSISDSVTIQRVVSESARSTKKDIHSAIADSIDVSASIAVEQIPTLPFFAFSLPEVHIMECPKEKPETWA